MRWLNGDATIHSTRRFPFSKAPRAVVPSAPVALRAVGRGVLDCRLRGKDTVAPSPGHPGRVATLSRRGRGVLAPSCMSFPRKWESSCFFLDCCLRGNDTGAVQRSLGSCLRRKDTVAPSPGGALGTAGLSRRGRGVLGSRIRGNHTGGRAGACQVGRWAGWVKGFRPNPPPAQDGKHA